MAFESQNGPQLNAHSSALQSILVNRMYRRAYQVHPTSATVQPFNFFVLMIRTPKNPTP